MAEQSSDSVETLNQQKGLSQKSPKKKWLKFCVKLLLWFFCILIVLLILLISCRDLLVATAIRKFVPKVTGTKVFLRDFVTTLNGSLHIRDLKLANPPGYTQPYLLQYESLYFKVDLPSLFSKMPVIEVIESKGITVNYEINGEGVSNIAAMQANVDNFLGEPKEIPETKDKASSEPAKEDSALLIRRLSFSNSKLQTGAISIPLPPVTLENIGGEESARITLRKNFEAMVNTVRLTGNSVTKGVSAFSNTGKKIVKTGIDAGKIFQSSIDAGKNIGSTFSEVFKNKNKKEKKEK